MFLCVLSVIASAETQPPHISWSQDQPITWDLFQASPPDDAARRSEAAAIHMTVSWHTQYTASCSDGVHWMSHVSSVVVTNTMEPTLSWVVPGRQTLTVLHHEQLHFDLSEVYRRKIERSLQQIGSCQALTEQEAFRQLDHQVKQVASALLARLSEMQELYDAQTSNGTNPDEQRRWSALIQSWLFDPLSAP